jgi:hypothetical protein
MLDGARAQALEQRQEFVTDPGAQKAGIAVRGVDRMRDLVAGNVRIHVSPPRAVKGPDAIAGQRWEDGEALGTSPAQQAHEEGLGPVVGVVPGGDPIGSEA